MAVKRLRLGKQPMWLGVCAGIAKYLNLDSAVVRVVWLFVTIFTGIFPGLLTYILAAWVMSR